MPGRSREEVRRFGRWVATQLNLLQQNLCRAAVVFLNRKTPRRQRLKFAMSAALASIAVVALWTYVYTILLIPFTPGIETLKKSRIEQPSVVLSADGEMLTQYRRVNREWVPREQISDHVVEALIATEDHRFYNHPGVDVIRTVGAMLRTIGGDRQGGSTITQQLARNMFPDRIGRRQTLGRKLKEMITAFKIEYAFDKEEILEAYLNTVPFYFGAYGIEMASRTYFNKSAADLDVLESATLVGMLKGTYYYNPVRHPERALERRNVALGQMVKRGFLEETQFVEMRDQPIRLSFERQREPGSRAPHFTEHVRMWLIDWADRHGYNIYRDSLVIHTTLDLDMQSYAERAVDRQGAYLEAVADVEWSMDVPRILARSPSAYGQFRRAGFSQLWESRPALARSFARGTTRYRTAVDAGMDPDVVLDSLLASPEFVDSLLEAKTRLEAGLVAVDPKSGRVRAWVGGRDFEKDQYDHVARARRQPGSTFKPFVYARALEEGYRPDDLLKDVEVEIPLENGYVWKPQNAGETVSGDEITLADGLAFSKNTITAQLVSDVGAADVAKLARRMGVNRSDLRAVPSLALGTSEVTLLEMASAYSTLANDGVYREPIIVTHIEDRAGQILEEFESRERRILRAKTARAVIDMMRGVVDRGTGNRIRSTFGIRNDVAGKTGTTQGNADGWFILMHPELVVGSWVGFNDPRVTFRTDYWGQGGNNALFLVGDFFRQILQSHVIENRDVRFPPPPEYRDDPSLLVRIAEWIGDVLSTAWQLLFGDDDDGGPRQDDTYIADRRRGSIQIDLNEDSDAVADSLTRREREANRLDSLLQMLPSRSTSETPDTAAAEERFDGPGEPDELDRQEELLEQEASERSGLPGAEQDGPPSVTNEDLRFIPVDENLSEPADTTG